MMHYSACSQQQSMVFTPKSIPLRLSVPLRREKSPTLQSHGPAHRPRGPHMSQRTARTAVAQAWTAPDREGGALTLVGWPYDKQGELRTCPDETGPCTTTHRMPPRRVVPATKTEDGAMRIILCCPCTVHRDWATPPCSSQKETLYLPRACWKPSTAHAKSRSFPIPAPTAIEVRMLSAAVRCSGRMALAVRRPVPASPAERCLPSGPTQSSGCCCCSAMGRKSRPCVLNRADEIASSWRLEGRAA